MLIIQNRIIAATPDAAATQIYEKHNPIQPPSIKPIMKCVNGTWYEYTVVIEE